MIVLALLFFCSAELFVLLYVLVQSLLALNAWLVQPSTLPATWV
jgi:hypothetical protein